MGYTEQGGGGSAITNWMGGGYRRISYSKKKTISHKKFKKFYQTMSNVESFVEAIAKAVLVQ